MKKLFLQQSPSSKEITNESIHYKVKSSKNHLEVNFFIQSKSEHINKKFSCLKSYKNWKLWEFDVCEVFLQPRTTRSDTKATYYEFQISPVNQSLELLIIKPREIIQTITSKIIKSQVTEIEGVKVISIKVPKFIYKDFPYLYMGLFACIGKPQRFYTHHKLKLNDIDFHLPQLFEKLTLN